MAALRRLLIKYYIEGSGTTYEHTLHTKRKKEKRKKASRKRRQKAVGINF